jgi:hypothetical protein
MTFIFFCKTSSIFCNHQLLTRKLESKWARIRDYCSSVTKSRIYRRNLVKILFTQFDENSFRGSRVSTCGYTNRRTDTAKLLCMLQQLFVANGTDGYLCLILIILNNKSNYMCIYHSAEICTAKKRVHSIIILCLIIRIQDKIIDTTCSRWFLARGFFYPEKGGDSFLRNVDSHKFYTAPYLRRRHSS